MTQIIVNAAEFAALKRRVEDLSIENQNITKNRDALRREKRELEGRTEEGVIITSSSLQVPQTMLRGNPQAYQLWKQRAAEQGKELQVILEHAPEPSSKPMPNTFTTDRVHYVSEDYVRGDGAKYRAEKQHAQAHNLTMQLCKSADDFPAEAFGDAK